MSTTHTNDEREGILIETATAKLMMRRVLENGAEPNYAREKLMRAFPAIVRHLQLDPHELIDAIERETIR
jgi:hypothetical protein